MQFSNINGAVKSPIDIRDYTINAIQDLPNEFQLHTPAIKNQGSESTCVAHALSSVIEYHYERQHDTKKKFSTDFIYGYRNPGYYIGDGMVIRDALKTVQKVGDTYKTDCSGNSDYQTAMKKVSDNKENLVKLAYPHRITSYVSLKSEQEIKTALYTTGPVIISMNWHNGYKLVNDVYTYKTGAQYGRHCVMIYGWNETGWLIQNSWGAAWAKDGRFILPYDFKINEAWGIVDNIQDSELIDINVPTTNTFLNFLSKCYNKLANFIIKIIDTFKANK